MIEILPGIYKVCLETTSPDSADINIYIIPGGKDGRVLMIDAGYRSDANKELMKKELMEASIPYDKLDIFLTHKHHDHTGLANFYHDRNAVIYMNPAEDIHPYDCLYTNNNEEALKSQETVLKTVGVTPKRTPELFHRFMEWNRGIQAETKASMYNEIKEYEYLPIENGQSFDYGDYHFKAFDLKGHTVGQMGLYDEEHRLLFCSDQMIGKIVPIVATSYFNDDLLGSYLRSVKEIPKRFAGYTAYPSHGAPFTNLEEVAVRIERSYQKKIDATYNFILTHPGKVGLTGMTVREIAFLSYGIDNDYGWESMYQTKMIITKTFSCLEYLRMEGKVKVLDAVAKKYGHEFEYKEYPSFIQLLME